MMSALRGRGLAQRQTVVLIGCVRGTVMRGMGYKNHKFLGRSYVNGP